MATYIVDGTLPGNDTFTKTQAQNPATPWRTIQHGFSNLAPGDTLQIKNATYNEQPSLTISGTQALPIVITNYPGHFPVVSAATFPTGNCINVNPSGLASGKISYVTIAGLEVRGAHSSGFKMIAVDHVTLRGNYIHHNGNVTPAQGISSRGWANVFDANHVAFNGIPTSNQGHGMYFNGVANRISNNIFEQNGAYGIQCAGYPFDATVDPTTNYSGCSSNLIANNTIAYQVDRAAIVLWNNGGGCSNNTIVNNIFYENAQGVGGITSAVDFDPSGGAVASNVITNNVHYATTPGGTVFSTNAGSCTSCTITNNHGLDLSFTNPNFVNAPATAPATPNYHLAVGSIARDFGLDLSGTFTTDFYGATRVTPWDVGAVEGNVSVSDTTAPTIPINVQVTAVTTASVTLTWTASTDNVGVTQYLIYRCQGGGCTNYAVVGTSATTTFVDTGVVQSTLYQYQVQATDAAGNMSGFSLTVTATTATLQAPTGLKVT